MIDTNDVRIQIGRSETEAQDTQIDNKNALSVNHQLMQIGAGTGRHQISPIRKLSGLASSRNFNIIPIVSHLEQVPELQQA